MQPQMALFSPILRAVGTACKACPMRISALKNTIVIYEPYP